MSRRAADVRRRPRPRTRARTPWPSPARGPHRAGRRPVARTVAIVAVALAATIATSCRRVEVPTHTDRSAPALAVHPLTHDGTDRFVHREGRGWFRVLASGDNVDRNTRLVLFPPHAPMATDQESCATWTDQTGRTTQQGLALRVRHDRGRWRAITITKNVWLGAPWNFNVHTWDSADGGAWRLRGHILVGVLVVFCLANTQKVTVDFLATETEAPLILVLVVTAVVGALLGALLRFSRRHD